MTSLRDLEQLKSEIVTLQQRLEQLQEPAPATPLEGVSAGAVMVEIQKATESERLRLQERQNIQLALPVLRQRLVEMERGVSGLAIVQLK